MHCRVDDLIEVAATDESEGLRARGVTGKGNRDAVSSERPSMLFSEGVVPLSKD